MFKMNLFFSWVYKNLIAFFILLFLLVDGHLFEAISQDKSRLVVLIILSSLFVTVRSGIRAFKLSRDLDRVKAGEPTRWDNVPLNDEKNRDSLKFKLFSRIQGINEYAGISVMLGLVGTVVGIAVAMTAMDANSINSANAASELIGSLSVGIGIAMYTTLAGALASIWAKINYMLLLKGTTQLYCGLVER